MYLGINDGNMEEGSLRCDANVSIRPIGQEKFGTRAELKNINSFRNIERAILYEVDRQAALLESGGKVIQETRLWDADKGVTQSMRGKEEAHDYRYFPDPDLLPLIVEETWIEKIKSELPELPDARKERLIQSGGLTPTDAEILTSSRGVAAYYEEILKDYSQPKKAAAWVINEFLRMIKADEMLIPKSPLKPKAVAETLQMVDDGKISGSIAKTVLQKVFETGKNPNDIIQAEGLTQMSDDGSLETVIDQVIVASPKEVERFKAGNDKLISFFVGQVMKQTGGRANPAKVNELLKKKLSL
jgi:aspartyl-tRNA(Asn)/glutamyl-tRNA(Gln) amidotransferase subunit B